MPVLNIKWNSVGDGDAPEQELIWFYVGQDKRVCYGHRAGVSYFDAEQGDEFYINQVTHWALFLSPEPPEAR